MTRFEIDRSKPKSLELIIDAFKSDSEAEKIDLIKQSIKLITDYNLNPHMPEILLFMLNLSPKSNMETIYAAKAVLCHILGIKLLVSCYEEDHRLAMRYIRECHKTIDKLAGVT